MKEKLTIGSDCSGVGALIHSIKRLGIDYKEDFACDFDYYARVSYLANHGTKEDVDLALSKEHKYFADNVKRISLSNTEYSDKDLKILSDANEFAKKFSFYYPFSMYQREVPKEPCGLYVSTVPCQSFSLAGKRQGKDDEKGRGILFFNSHEFIQKNKPRFFIFENVKGLISDDSGKTFNEWITLLGGKSINGDYQFFPHEDSVPYHIYYAVLNAKNFNVPQNRERVFIIGIRDDEDNDFSFPKEVHLEKRLKDVLETDVDEKYFLSEKMVNGLLNKPTAKQYPFKPHSKEDSHSSCLTARYFKMGATDPYIKEEIEVGTWRTHDDGKGFRATEDNNCPTIPARAREDGSGQPVIKISSATSKGYEEATNEDSRNLSNPHSKTRRGRVGKGVAQTLDTSCNQGIYNGYRIRRLTPLEVFRLMDFPDSHIENCRKVNISDSQLYKQAGNSIVVKCLELIIKNLKLV